MRRLMLRNIRFSLALAAIAVASVAGGALVAFKSVEAFGFSQGGRITLVKICVLDTPAIAPVTCATSCPLCTATWGTACASRNEIIFQPAGGIGTYACPAKAELYRGGGTTPRIGAWTLIKALFTGGPLIMPGLSR